MSFNTKIQQYVGSITNLDTESAVKQSIDYTLGFVKSRAPHLLSMFSRKIEATSSDSLNLRDKNIFDVSKVEREDGNDIYLATPMASEVIHKLGDAKSIYYAQAYSPSYTIDFESNLKIFPAPDATDKAYVYAVVGSAGKTVNVSSNTTIEDNAVTYWIAQTAEENFPENWKTFIVLQSSEILLKEKIADLTLGTSSATDAESWLADEDESMVASTLTVVKQLESQINIVAMAKQEFLASQGVGGISDNKNERPV